MNQSAEVKITDTQYHFLRTRYGKRKGIAAGRLVKLAVLEVVGMQAQKELDENGYHVVAQAKQESSSNWLSLLPAVVAPLSPAERNQFVLDTLTAMDKAGVEVAGCAADDMAVMMTWK